MWKREDMQAVNPGTLARPRGYNHGMIRGGRTLFVAGQIGWTADETLVSDRFVDQFDQALANVLAVVSEAGGAAEQPGPAHDLCRGQERGTWRRSGRSANGIAPAWGATTPP